MACGMCDIAPNTFYDMTFRQFKNIRRGKYIANGGDNHPKIQEKTRQQRAESIIAQLRRERMQQ